MRTGLECPLCESPNSRRLHAFKNQDIVECEHCGMVYVPTPAPEFTVVYKRDYLAPNPNGLYHLYRSEFSNHLKTFTQRLEESEKILGGRVGRLLDVGCALGHLGESARRRGWDVYVTDVSEYAVLQAREQFGLNGFICAPEKIPVQSSRFDLVTLFDVISHVSHPKGLLKEIRKALWSGGILHVVTPNFQSLSARILGRRWYHIEPDSSYLYFTPETLKSMLEQSGFEVIKFKSAPVHFRLHDLLLRFEHHSRSGFKWIARSLRWICRRMGVKDIRFRLPFGEIQVWARPADIHQKREIQPVKDILDIVCCPNCHSAIQLFEDHDAICTQCELEFEVQSGVINFSSYAKRRATAVLFNWSKNRSS